MAQGLSINEFYAAFQLNQKFINHTNKHRYLIPLGGWWTALRAQDHVTYGPIKASIQIGPSFVNCDSLLLQVQEKDLDILATLTKEALYYFISELIKAFINNDRKIVNLDYFYTTILYMSTFYRCKK